MAKKASKKKVENNEIDLVSSGGHAIEFEGRRVYPQNFILRHYICLSKNHIIDKYYSSRVFSKKEIEERGWHGNRATFTPDKLTFPSKDELKIISGNSWDRSDICKQHTFM